MSRASCTTALAACAVLTARVVCADPPVASGSPGVTVERVAYDRAREFLWPANAPDTTRCDAASAPVECLLEMRWSQWPAARDTVLALWRTQGIVSGVERAHTMDGAYRGMVRIVPELPVGPYAQQLAWVDQALRDQDAFYRSIAARANAAIAYRWTGLGVLFFRSVATHTPAGYAVGWYFAYNVVGGINDSLERIRLTLIHEVFHLNDRAHGWWSHQALQPIYDAILRRCGNDTHCLEPYAPVLLRVRRTGMFYAFQSGNGDVAEYAAMLAERYYLEQSGAWQGRPFRCGPRENAAAWRALIAEFFAGYDRGVPCPVER